MRALSVLAVAGSAALLLTTRALAQAPNASSTRFSIELTPALITLGGKDYEGIGRGTGVQVGAHLHFGVRSIGATYRQASHDPDVSSIDVGLPGINAGMTMKGIFLDFRQEMDLGPESKFVPYASGEFGFLKQAFDVSAGSLSVEVEANGFAGGGGLGLLYRITPVIDFLGEVGFHLLGFQAFDLPNDAGAGTESVGYDVGIRAGIRARLGGQGS